nr:MAG TPA: hypothetical protein [Crassvirales sp.]
MEKKCNHKEFAIGTKIEHNGKLYEVVKSNTCEDCSIANICSNCDRSSDNAIGDVFSRDQRVNIFGECSAIQRSDDTPIVFKELVDDNSNDEFYKVIPLYIDDKSIQLRPVEFDLPKGYEIDKEHSDLDKGIIRFKSTWLTITQLYELAKGKSYFTNRDAIKDFCNSKIVVLANLMDIARYFNGDWKYDPTKKDEVGYMICYDKFAKIPYYYSQNINSNTDVYYGNVIFKNEADAQYVINNPNFKIILDKIFKV